MIPGSAPQIRDHALLRDHGEVGLTPHEPSAAFKEAMSTKILVCVKRVVDYNVKIRVKGTGPEV